jgi:polo-like kinase 1
MQLHSPPWIKSKRNGGKKTTGLIFFFHYRTHRFIEQGTLQTYQHTPPSHLRRKHHLLTSFYHYMNAKLATTVETNHHHQEGIYLVKYIVTDEAVIFRLSNNVIQVKKRKQARFFFLPSTHYS